MKLKESLLSRRWFLTGLIGGALTALTAYVANPMVRFLFHKKKLPLPKAVKIAIADIDKMATNSASYFRYGHMPAVLLKTEEGDLRIFSARCTHLDCTVQYKPDTKKFFCTCHDGYFNDLGENIQGPPPKPLPEFDMTIEGEQLVVSFDEKKNNNIQSALNFMKRERQNTL